MNRIGLVIGVVEDRIDEYEEAHRNIPEHVLQAMRDANVRNFTIFTHGDRLFGYLEHHGDDFEADMKLMAENPDMQDWWELTTQFQFFLPGSSEVYGWTPLREIWHMA